MKISGLLLVVAFSSLFCLSSSFGQIPLQSLAGKNPLVQSSSEKVDHHQSMVPAHQKAAVVHGYQRRKISQKAEKLEKEARIEGQEAAWHGKMADPLMKRDLENPRDSDAMDMHSNSANKIMENVAKKWQQAKQQKNLVKGHSDAGSKHEEAKKAHIIATKAYMEVQAVEKKVNAMKPSVKKTSLLENLEKKKEEAADLGKVANEASHKANSASHNVIKTEEPLVNFSK